MKQTIKYLCFVFLCLLVTFGKHTEASAAVRDITVADDDQIKVEVCVGDTGRIVVTGDSSRIVEYEYLTSAMDDSELMQMEPSQSRQRGKKTFLSTATMRMRKIFFMLKLRSSFIRI